MRLPIIALVAIVMCCTGCRTDQAPEHRMIEAAFFKCEKCLSLEGGIYGKGPFKSLHTAGASGCVHHWQRIERKEFRDLATRWSGVDWSKEISFWNAGLESTPGPTRER